MPVFPPMLRIDHVLVGEGVSVLGQRTGTGRGSDHRPLVTDLAIR
jgi:endonuclease/exonuclease/phosphatase (EEP) superfamily protein YafD